LKNPKISSQVKFEKLQTQTRFIKIRTSNWKLFNALKCIPPTSVESERAFSITGQFATKLRTKLDDDTLSSLVFLKAFYKNEAPN
jgi:hypothetical protein